MGYSKSLARDPISLLFYILVTLRNSLYERQILLPKKAPGFVLGIGNISWGGSGKTPFCVHLASWAHQRGYKVAVISRGYKGSLSSNKPVLVSDGERLYHSAREVGDEAIMIANRLKGVPVIICKDRFRAISFAYNDLKRRLFILDDAFQHRKIKKDIDLVVVDAGALKALIRFDAFRMREPLSSLKRSDAILIVRPFMNVTNEEYSNISDYGKPIYFASVKAEGLWDPYTSNIQKPETLEGKKVFAFCGIARPERFRHTLEALGAKISDFVTFRDHHFYSIKELQDISSQSKGSDMLITTEKDWAKIKDFQNIMERLPQVLLVRLEIEREEEFFGWLESTIGKK